MKTFCPNCGKSLEYASISLRPNFCFGCGSALSPVAQAAKTKLKAKVPEPEEDEDEQEDDLEVPTDIRVVIEGAPNWQAQTITLGQTIGQTAVSERMNRPAKGKEVIESIRAKLNNPRHSIQIG